MFNNINEKLATIKLGLKKKLDDLVAESLSKMKDSIIEALPWENFITSSKIGESYFSVANWFE